MRNQKELMPCDAGEELIGIFGEARLIQVRDKVYLRGGSMADRMEALEWIALFMPEGIVRLER